MNALLHIEQIIGNHRRIANQLLVLILAILLKLQTQKKIRT